MAVIVLTSNGPVTSYREAWKGKDGGPVYVWRTDGPQAHDFGSVAAAEAWMARVNRLSTEKEITEAGWTVSEE